MCIWMFPTYLHNQVLKKIITNCFQLNIMKNDFKNSPKMEFCFFENEIWYACLGLHENWVSCKMKKIPIVLYTMQKKIQIVEEAVCMILEPYCTFDILLDPCKAPIILLWIRNINIWMAKLLGTTVLHSPYGHISGYFVCMFYTFRRSLVRNLIIQCIPPCSIFQFRLYYSIQQYSPKPHYSMLVSQSYLMALQIVHWSGIQEELLVVLGVMMEVPCDWITPPGQRQRGLTSNVWKGEMEGNHLKENMEGNHLKSILYNTKESSFF